MTYYNLFLFLSVISISHLIAHVSALNGEGIANGFIAEQSNFKYQVAIFGKSPRDENKYLRCSGAMVAANWILTVAHCFMLTSTSMKRLIFTAYAGTTNLNAQYSATSRVDVIYIYYYNSTTHANDITMARTERSLILGDKINEVEIPTSGESFFNREGVVSGYGYSEVTKVFNDIQGTMKEVFIKTETDLQLRYTTVIVMESMDCAAKFSYASDDNKFCGKAIYNEEKYTGTCWNDAGSPLVIENKVVGLAGESHQSCDDTLEGSLYINVADYYDIVNNILNDVFVTGLIEYTLYRVQ